MSLFVGLGKLPWRREWIPTPVLLPREFHGWRSLTGYSLGSQSQIQLSKEHSLFSFFTSGLDITVGLGWAWVGCRSRVPTPLPSPLVPGLPTLHPLPWPSSSSFNANMGPLIQEKGCLGLEGGRGMRTGRIRILTSSHKQKEKTTDGSLPNQLWEPRSTQGFLPQRADIPPLMSPKQAWPQPVLQHLCPWGQDVSPSHSSSHGRGSAGHSPPDSATETEH